MKKGAKAILYGCLATAVVLTAVTTASLMNKKSVAHAEPETTITVLISSIENKDGRLLLKADPIAWYQGDEANKIFAERDPEGAAEIGGVPDGYYIVNDDKTETTYELSDQAEVLMQLLNPKEIKWNEEISVSQFVEVMDHKENYDQTVFPYHLTLKDGKVVKVVQQYLP
ncbi:hypothetical protein [Gorillibacterium sp. CAU 1737]|uniref:hypothetical protein n=1 Tax=Gorillibacterium sp. CAU 1737 TaxID=3140362 RepID=UPI0032619BEE